MNHAGTILRESIANGAVVCPGAWNGLIAKTIAKTGFDACYVSGGATANSVGYPDTGLITMDDMCRKIQEVVSASGLPVIADADTGFGDDDSVAQTIKKYDQSGAAGMHIEDQEFPKRCGHLDGKTLISQDEMVQKISIASDSRLNDDFILIARTDAYSVEGMQAAVDRGNAYREAGADMIFPEGLSDEEAFETFAQGCEGLLLANMTEFGKTPHITTERFDSMGYNIVIFPVTMQRVAMGAVTHCLTQLRKEGTAEGFQDKMQTRQDLYDLLGYEPGALWEPTK